MMKLRNFCVLWSTTLLLFVETKSLYENRMRRNEYDYIVVGAGSAGNVVASRLSEDGQSTVLLLEAGGEPPPLTDIPYFTESAQRTDIDWGFSTEPQTHANFGLHKRQSYYARGKVLGGTSVINTMKFVRGNPRDFDEWESQEGAVGWSWKDVFHYVLKPEDTRIPLYRDSEYRGKNGPITVTMNPTGTPLNEAFVEAAKSMGLPEIDLNGPTQFGASSLQENVRDGLRCSTEKAYLRPAVHRPNLDVLTYAHVTRIQFDEDKTARWVRFDRNNRSHSVSAKKEIILSAGVFGSPHILLLSGIGPKRQLESFGIPVISDLPVGENLQDHVSTGGQLYAVNSSVGMRRLQDVKKSDIGDLIGGKGLLTTQPGAGFAFFNTKYGIEGDVSGNWPDIELYFASKIYPDVVSWNEKMRKLMEKYKDMDVFTMMPMVMRAKSRGHVKLRSSNPYDHPLIDPQYLTEESDLKVLVEGMKFAEKMVQTPYFQQYAPVRIPEEVPGCEGIDKSSDAYLACLAVTLTQTCNHQCCSCKMGNAWHPSTVLDPMLRVKGVANLRVVDASSFPTMVTSNTLAPTVMLAEKASDMIRGRRWDPINQRLVF